MSLWSYDEVIKLIKKAKTAGCLLHACHRSWSCIAHAARRRISTEHTDAHRTAEENDERWLLASSKRHRRCDRWRRQAFRTEKFDGELTTAAKLKDDRLKIDGRRLLPLRWTWRDGGRLTASTAAAAGCASELGVIQHRWRRYARAKEGGGSARCNGIRCTRRHGLGGS